MHGEQVDPDARVQDRGDRAEIVMTSTQRRARRVKMTPSLIMESSRQTTSSATWPHAITRMPATEYGTTRYPTSGKVLAAPDAVTGTRSCASTDPEQEDDQGDAEEPDDVPVHLSTLDVHPSIVNRLRGTMARTSAMSA